MQSTHGTFNLERTPVRPRDGLHRSANQESRRERAKKLQEVCPISVAIGRRLLTHSVEENQVARFIYNMGALNKGVGEVVDPQSVLLRYISPQQMSELFDDYFAKHESGGILTPRGRKDKIREVKDKLRAQLKEATTNPKQPNARLDANIRKRILDGSDGVVGLGLRASDVETRRTIDGDISLINSALGRVGLVDEGMQYFGFADLELVVPTFQIDEEQRNNRDLEIVRPLVPLAQVSFQPVGVY
jgi:hypothetical protein